MSHVLYSRNSSLRRTSSYISIAVIPYRDVLASCYLLMGGYLLVRHADLVIGASAIFPLYLDYQISMRCPKAIIQPQGRASGF
jgi:hypothetical protein